MVYVVDGGFKPGFAFLEPEVFRESIDFWLFFFGGGVVVSVFSLPSKCFYAFGK